ncbi:unnamed protein product, partial [Nesidiocoris tenuis]
MNLCPTWLSARLPSAAISCYRFREIFHRPMEAIREYTVRASRRCAPSRYEPPVVRA